MREDAALEEPPELTFDERGCRVVPGAGAVEERLETIGHDLVDDRPVRFAGGMGGRGEASGRGGGRVGRLPERMVPIDRHGSGSGFRPGTVFAVMSGATRPGVGATDLGPFAIRKGPDATIIVGGAAVPGTIDLILRSTRTLDADRAAGTGPLRT